jgi:uncharacterized damage-inducible protein DinB
MDMIKMLQKEFENESQTTRKMLERVPNDRYDWKPHEKSMSVRQLATHIAELPSWIKMVASTDELDFATTPYNPPSINQTADLMKFFENNLKEGREGLDLLNEKVLNGTWTLRKGDDIYSAGTRAEFIRITYSQVVHHRAQMGVYLRLLNIPIPGSYGPSADDISF